MGARQKRQSKCIDLANAEQNGPSELGRVETHINENNVFRKSIRIDHS